MLYLFAYDIADPRRLQKIGRLMDKRGLRCQKSVFLYAGDAAAVEAVLREVAALLDLEVDIIQAWKLAKDQTAEGTYRGLPLNLRPPAVVLGNQDALL